MKINIAKLRALRDNAMNNDKADDPWGRFCHAAYACWSDLLEAAEERDRLLLERDASLLERMKAVEEATRLRALRCDCDEEAGGHAGDCVTLMPGIIEGMGEEIVRLRAEIEHVTSDRDILRCERNAAQDECERLRDTAAHDGAIKKMLHSDVQHLRAELERMRLSDGDVEALKHAAREMKWLTGMATIGEADRMICGSAATVIQRIIDAAKGG